MTVTIYHNPRCNASRKTLALLEKKGVKPEVVEYLKTPPNDPITSSPTLREHARGRDEG